jgi:hypothetical protein
MNSIDTRIVQLVLDNYSDIVKIVKERQAVTRDFYERQFAVIGTESPAEDTFEYDLSSTN